MHRLVVVFVLLSFAGFGQIATRKSNAELKELEKAAAIQNIRDLKSGILLFRLNTRSQEIEYYLKYDNVKAAENVAAKQRLENERIVTAFRKKFDFCEVYFFPDTLSRRILDKKWDELVFYNDSLQIDTTIHPTFEHVFIAEKGITEGRQSEGYVSDTYISSDENGTHKKKRMYDEANLNVPGIIIRDQNFVQLQPPFPYFVKVFNEWPTQGRYFVKVLLLNEKLHNFNQ